MSEFTNHKSERIKKLTTLFQAILINENEKELYTEYRKITDLCIPLDVVYLVDEMVKTNQCLLKIVIGNIGAVVDFTIAVVVNSISIDFKSIRIYIGIWVITIDTIFV